jgi:DNA polymerase-1
MPRSSGKPSVFLLRAMPFIFRAYHAVQRQCPLSAHGGVLVACI